jgi:hypothetical protein
MTAGLLLDGKLVPTPGVTVIPPASHGGPAWNLLGVDDYMARQLPVSLIGVHSTGGHWPQPIHAGGGPAGHAQQILEMWLGADHGGGERVHSAAQIVVDFDGTAFCAADIVRSTAYHAQLINGRAVGIEMCTLPDGSIYEATLDATAQLIALLTHSGLDGAGLLPIPFQMPRGPYRNQPLRRLEVGGVQTDGRGLVGVIGHRDQTGARGRGDPGDAILARLAALGAEGVDFDGSEDLALGRARQARLNAIDAKDGNTLRPLVVDGVFGPATATTMHRIGFRRWRDVA